MNFSTIKIAFNAIVTNRIRAFLTILGIIIGISAVIAMLSLGQGAQNSILNQVGSLGSNTISVIPISNFGGAAFGNPGSLQRLVTSKLDYRLYNRFLNKVKFPEIVAIGPEATGSYEVSYRSKTKFSTIYGVTADYQEVRDLKVETGRFISENDNNKLKKTAVIGSRVKESIFGESDPIGKDMQIDGNNYTVVGIMTEKGSNFDDRVYIPLNTATASLIGNKDFNQLTVKVRSEKEVDAVALRIEEELRDYYRLRPDDDDNFTVFTSADILTLTASITSIFTGLLASIASISLVVGGIGIMNIMLVSVTERTKEIGLRKAIGAKKRAILAQFLAEAVILTMLGGFIGIMLGITLASIIGKVANIPVIVSVESIILSTSVSIIIGIVFGFYPAYRAAHLNPIDALRYE